jgi:hypothetical protein
MTENYTVTQGDCMASIAGSRGFFWETLWNLPENSNLKQKRKNPNILMEGDTIVIPDRRIQQMSAATEERHRYRRKGVPSKFRLRLLAEGKPRSNLAYKLDVDGKIIIGKTDSDGLISETIPPGAKTGKLTIQGDIVDEKYIVNFGHLNPVEEITGVQHRLANLGYDCEVTGFLDEQTTVALKTFQGDNQLDTSGQLDEPTRKKIQDEHGC